RRVCRPEHRARRSRRVSLRVGPARNHPRRERQRRTSRSLGRDGQHRLRVLMTIRSTRRWPTAPSDVAAMVLQRAIDAVVWGVPLVGFDAMRRAFGDTGARCNDILYWPQPADARLQLVTPSAHTYYVHTHVNTLDGPVVLEVPACAGAWLFGSILDA